MLQNFKKPDGDPVKPSPSSGSVGSSLGSRPSMMLRSGGSGAPSIIGVDLLISGNLISKGEVQVEGEVQGDIHSTHVIVGERARITGSVIAEEVVVRGHVMGSVRGKRVLLQTSSHVEGDIYHQTLAIEQGAYFEGKSRRTEDPTAGMLRPEARASLSAPASPTLDLPVPGTEPSTG